MKKLLLSVSLYLLLPVLLMSACGGSTEDTSPIPIRSEVLLEPNTATLPHFLYDIDYMLHVLETNFALFDVAYWARVVGIRALSANARQAVLDVGEDLDEDGFLQILIENFQPLFNIGHFNIFCVPGRLLELRLHLSSGHPYAVINAQTLHSPLAERFYLHRAGLEIDEDEITRKLLNLHPTLERLLNMDPEDLTDDELVLLMEIVEQVAHYEGMLAGITLSEEEIAEVMVEILGGRFRNVNTKIIEEGRIGYVSVNSFMRGDFAADQRQIFEFYREIRGFEHLIIDLRNNGGGHPNWFTDIFVRPNLETAITVDLFYFYIDAPYIRHFIDQVQARPTLSTNIIFMGREFKTAQEILAEFDFPDRNAADFDRFDYGLTARFTGFPTRVPGFDGPAFDGKIWFLTGERMGSGAQISATIAKESGLMTLVGEVTGGVYGGNRAMVLLPNTGIAFHFDTAYVTDIHGRPLEAGTIPHHFNRPGMDALQTVLALIAEGEY